MLLILSLAVLSCALSLCFTPLVRVVATRVGLVDRPDQHRKIHKRAVPRIGGVAVMLSVGIAVGALLLLRGKLGVSENDLTAIAQLIPAVAIVFVTGLYDDLSSLSAWPKLAGQVAAASLVCWAGVQIHSIGSFSIADYWWHIPLTVFWLVGCTNAVNLIDGLDGLAAGIGLFATITTLVAALLDRNLGLALAAAPLAGALFGFLRFNFNPATIFLGDSGSLSIGFLLGCYGVIWSQKSATALGMAAPLIALCIPLLDTGLAILRRFIQGRPVFGADRRHIHHRLLDLGLTHRDVALVMYGVAGVAAVCSLLVGVFQNHIGGLVVLLFCAAVCVGIQRLGYNEFSEAGSVVFGGLVPRAIAAGLCIERIDARLAAATTPDECWKVIAGVSKEFGFNQVDLKLNSQQWTLPTGDALPSECWHLRIPLAEAGFVQFAVPFETRPVRLARLAETVSRNLRSKSLKLGSTAPSPVPAPSLVFETREVASLSLRTRLTRRPGPGTA